MSEKSNSSLKHARIDPRTRRSQDALLETLVCLVRERRYDQIQIADIVRGSGVGRSTFYDHYRGVDDMIVETMAHMLEVLASAVDESPPHAPIEHVLAHFHENRTFARHLFSAPTTQHLARRIQNALSERIAKRLEARTARSEGRLLIDVRSAAQHLAAGQIEWVRVSLASDAPFDAVRLAHAMIASAGASAAALFAPNSAPH